MKGLVQKLINDSTIWAGKFACFCPNDAELAWHLKLDVFEYALMQVKTSTILNGNAPLIDLLIHEACSEFIRQNHEKSVDCEAARQAMVLKFKQPGNHGVTGFEQQAFQDFCTATGLSSSELTGTSVNLISILFYFSIFNRITQSGDLGLKEKNALLAACRQCREYFSNNFTPMDYIPQSPALSTSKSESCRQLEDPFKRLDLTS